MIGHILSPTQSFPASESKIKEKASSQLKLQWPAWETHELLHYQPSSLPAQTVLLGTDAKGLLRYLCKLGCVWQSSSFCCRGMRTRSEVKQCSQAIRPPSLLQHNWVEETQPPLYCCKAGKSFLNSCAFVDITHWTCTFHVALQTQTAYFCSHLEINKTMHEIIVAIIIF